MLQDARSRVMFPAFYPFPEMDINDVTFRIIGLYLNQFTLSIRDNGTSPLKEATTTALFRVLDAEKGHLSSNYLESD